MPINGRLEQEQMKVPGTGRTSGRSANMIVGTRLRYAQSSLLSA